MLFGFAADFLSDYKIRRVIYFRRAAAAPLRSHDADSGKKRVETLYAPFVFFKYGGI